MKAMILAAGKGTRVRPITHTIPKPLIPILQKPVMEFLVELLRQHGFDQIVVNVSHLANEIEGYFRDGQRFGVEIAYSFEGKMDEEGNLVGEAVGSAGGMKRIQDFNPFFDDTFVVLCGDALIDLDLTEAVRWHKEKKAIATVVMKSVPIEEVPSYGVVVTDENGRILAFQEKPSVDEALSNNINTGIYIFEPEVLDYIPSKQAYDIGSELFPKLVTENAPFYGIAMDFQWVDIGKVPDYWHAIRDVLQGKIKNVPIPGHEVFPGVYTGLNVAVNWDRVDITGPVYIGGMTRIEDGVKIVGPAAIGRNCRLGANSRIENTVIFEYSRIGTGVRLVDKLVFGRYCVDKTGASIDMQAAALNWLITDNRQVKPKERSPEQEAIAKLLWSEPSLIKSNTLDLP
jgi:mannose-1-phosphate guanylyltransferase